MACRLAGAKPLYIWTIGILLIGTLGTNCNEILIEIHTVSFKEMRLKMSGKWRPCCLGLNVLMNILNKGSRPRFFYYLFSFIIEQYVICDVRGLE